MTNRITAIEVEKEANMPKQNGTKQKPKSPGIGGKEPPKKPPVKKK